MNTATGKKLPEEVLCDAVENAWTGPMWAGIEYDGNQIPEYFTLLMAAKMLLITAKHFAPCTGPEFDCKEVIAKITEMQFTKSDDKTEHEA